MEIPSWRDFFPKTLWNFGQKLKVTPKTLWKTRQKIATVFGHFDAVVRKRLDLFSILEIRAKIDGVAFSEWKFRLDI